MSMFPRNSRLLTGGLLAFGAILLVLGVFRISFKVDPLKLLPGDLKEVQGLQLYVDHFARPNELIVAVSGEAEAVDSAAKSLAESLRKSDLVESVYDRAPWEDDPVGLAGLVAFAMLNLPPETFEVAQQELAAPRSQERIQDSLQKLTYSMNPADVMQRSFDPVGVIELAMGKGAASLELLEGDLAAFSSSDGTLRLIYVNGIGHDDRSDFQDLIDWITALRVEIDAWSESEPLSQQVEIQFTGEPAFVADISSSMRGDMRRSGVLTLVLIGGVFWLWYRRVKPLFALVTSLTLIFVITLGTAGWLIRDLTVISVGFASILIGLCVDYGVLLFHSTLRNPGDGAKVRGENQRAILYAGATTASAFAALTFSSMNGLAELGLLVGIGIGVGALVMLTLFVTVMRRMSRDWAPKPNDEVASPLEPALFNSTTVRVMGWAVLVMVSVLGLVLLIKGTPEFDRTDESLRPRESEAYDALDLITGRMLGGKSVGNLVVRGDSPQEVMAEMERVAPLLEVARETGDLDAYYLPQPFLPITAHQLANLEALTSLVTQKERLVSEIEAVGFTEDASALVSQVFGQFEKWLEAGPGNLANLPEGPTAKWILSRMQAPATEGEFVAAGMLQISPGADVRYLADGDQVYVAEWIQTVNALDQRVAKDLRRIFLVLATVLITLLFLAFRRVAEVIWVIVSVSLSLVALMGCMSLFGWTWNLFNFGTLLLTFGAGLDYSTHMLLGFRRHNNDVALVQKNVGQALLVCALSTVAGFGSLVWASNGGLSSLGQLCALGLLLNALVAVYLLPKLWLWWGPDQPRKSGGVAEVERQP